MGLEPESDTFETGSVALPKTKLNLLLLALNFEPIMCMSHLDLFLYEARGWWDAGPLKAEGGL